MSPIVEEQPPATTVPPLLTIRLKHNRSEMVAVLGPNEVSPYHIRTYYTSRYAQHRHGSKNTAC
jgi:hypothetical protein